jgi:hypothetical protein
MSHRRPRSIRLLLGSLLGVIALMAAVGTTQALALAPHWKIVARSAPSYLQPGVDGEITLLVVNLGDAPVTATPLDPIVITDHLPAADHLPAGVEAIAAMKGQADVGTEKEPINPPLECEPLPEPRSELRCKFTHAVPSFISLELKIPVRATRTISPGEKESNEVTVEGANAPSQTTSDPLSTSPDATPFGVESYELSAEDEDGSPDQRAGSHPFQLTTTLDLNQVYKLGAYNKTQLYPGSPALIKNVDTTLPPGLIGNATAAIPRCSAVDFETDIIGGSDLCPANTAIGVALVTFKEPDYLFSTVAVPVFNLEPAKGEPARLGFEFHTVPVTLNTSVKTGKGYAVEVKASYSSEVAEVLGTIVTIWGVPGESAHREARGWSCLGEGHWEEGENPQPCPISESSTSSPVYLTLPTTCSKEDMNTTMAVQSWEPGAAEVPDVGTSSPSQLQGCEQLPFAPSLSVTSDRQETSTPSGLNVGVTVPQGTTTADGGLAEADIKETTMILPEGLQVNPGSADGLATCGVAETGFAGQNGDSGATLGGELAAQEFEPGAVKEAQTPGEANACEKGSKIGEVAIDSPLLERPLNGSLYLGQQDTDPFTSPLVIYLIAEDPESGVRVKVAGEVRISQNGRLTTVFKGTPPLPFEKLEVHLLDGPRASQSTPAYCRPAETTASFVPSSGEEEAHAASSFTPTSGPNGTACPSGPLPFTPSQQAGVTNTQAGAFSPFTLTIERPDGDQALKTITTQLPQGAAALIASVTPCPEPQAADGTCGPESEIGESTASSGLGSDPYTLPGAVYLTGPYDGAPFGLSSVTNAEHVGPFDVGRVVVRSSININENTAAATIDTDASQFFAKSGEVESFGGLPEILKGAPAQIKQLHVIINRPGFEFNPTNCSPMQITGTLTGSEGSTQSVSSPFQVTNCSSLPFAPKLTATVAGKGSKANGTTFDVKVESPGLGQANIHKVDLTIPAVLPSRLTTIQKACLAAVFEANPAACDEGAMIGEGIVHTPVFKNPLRGPAYLVSHGNAAFPDVEFVLQGEGIKLVLDGKTYIHDGITYSKFETAPDAPFTKFESNFPAGPHSALTAHVPEDEYFSLCKTKVTMPTEITGQNGAFISQTTKVAVVGCGGVASYKVTRAQELAKALKACKKYKKKSKRVACEKAAHKKYGSKAKKTSKKKK